MNLIETFQDLVAQVPELVQPLIVALAGAIPFIEGEGAVSIGIIGGIPPVVAAIAAIVGNFLCVLVVVLVSSGARQAVVNRSRAKAVALAGGGTTEEGAVGTADIVHSTPRREKFQRAFERYGVPGVSCSALSCCRRSSRRRCSPPPASARPASSSGRRSRSSVGRPSSPSSSAARCTRSAEQVRVRGRDISSRPRIFEFSLF